MTNTAKIIWVVVLVIIVLAIIGFTRGGSDNTAVQNSGPIKIGFIGPLTGDASAYGQPVHDGVSLAVDDINAAGGINGRQVEVIYEDGKCNGKDSASAAQKLVNVDRVKVIIGGFCSGESFGAAPITEPAKVILFSGGSSAPNFTELGDFVFRNHPSDNAAGEQLAAYMVPKYKKIAVVSENTDYAQGLKNVFNAEVAANGSSIVFDESFSSDTKDFRSIVSKLKGTGAEAVFLSVQTGRNASLLAKQIRDLGFTMPFFTAYLVGPEFVESGPAVEGTVIIDAPGLGSGERAKHVLDSYRAKFNREPNYIFFVGTSYDATQILADAIREVGEDTTKIRDYLYALKDYNGSIGTYSLDQNGDVIGLNLVLRQVRGGKVVEL